MSNASALPRVFFVMGVSGSGKTTVGKLLGALSGLPFFDGDDFHSAENIEKMKSGQPLNDNDRVGWLRAINRRAALAAQETGGIFACSALKSAYRRILSENIATQTEWVFLDGDYGLIRSRIEDRKGHFMPIALLQSQFDALERPENAVQVDLTLEPAAIADQLMAHFRLKKAFGLIGLGVMGKSLSRNLGRNGVTLALYNRYVAGKEEEVAVRFIADHDELKAATGFEDLALFVGALERPRKVFLMVNAGAPTDAVLENLGPLLEPGDVVMDGGNAHYRDTARRMAALSAKGIHFLGVGVSGGEEGALNGPSIMAGGPEEAYQLVAPFLERIAAKRADGSTCCARVGAGEAGHFVKMAHNGIEYAEMQLLAETYDLLRRSPGKSREAIAGIFESWNRTETGSYLLEITIDILRKKSGGGWVLDTILDAASGKGTGAWATIAAAELGVPATMISEALFARYLSSFWKERQQAAEIYGQEAMPILGALHPDVLGQALQVARIVNHHQGFQLIATASSLHNWEVQLHEVARIWTNGCIIRSGLMERLTDALKNTANILTSSDFKAMMVASKPALAEVVAAAANAGIAVPCFAAALNYLNAFAQSDSPMHLVQAQRDYFGAHTYQRRDDPEGPVHHTHWTA